jgi:hypothetical protein
MLTHFVFHIYTYMEYNFFLIIGFTHTQNVRPKPITCTTLVVSKVTNCCGCAVSNEGFNIFD